MSLRSFIILYYAQSCRLRKIYLKVQRDCYSSVTCSVGKPFPIFFLNWSSEAHVNRASKMYVLYDRVHQMDPHKN